MSYRRKMLVSVRTQVCLHCLTRASIPSVINYLHFVHPTQPPIIRHVIHDDTEQIERMLKINPLKMVVSDPNRRTPLHLAASLGRTEVVQLFLKRECFSVNYRDNDLVTPLHRAWVMVKHVDKGFFTRLLSSRWRAYTLQ